MSVSRFRGPSADPTWKARLALVWGGELVSVLTSSVLQMGLIWHITITTGSAGMLSLASLAGFLPLAIFGTVAGAVVDRLSVGRVLVLADLAIAAVSAAVALASAVGALTVEAVIAALFLRAVGSAFHTPAFQSLTPLVAPPEHLTRLAGVSQAVQSGGYIAGTALAAVMYPAFGLTAMVVLDVVGALVASASVLLARLDAPAREGGGQGGLLAPWTLFSEVVGGYRELRSHPGLFSLLWCGFAFTVVFSPIAALFPLMSLGHFGTGTDGAALAEIVFSVGMIAGSALLGATGGFSNRAWSIVAATATFGAAVLAAGLIGRDGFAAFLVTCLVMGMSSPLYSGPQVALMQEKVAPECLGRVFGLYGSVMAWAMPLGLAASSLLADAVGAPAWFVWSGVVMVVLAGVTLAIPSVRAVERTSAGSWEE